MANGKKMVWDNTGERRYETGINKAALYLIDENGAYPKGVPWNGITSVSENPSGAEATPLYADNIKYLNLMSAEEFGATIEAYTYPEEFELCDGSATPATGVYVGQQPRKKFALTYQTRIGDDIDGTTKGYKIHLIYNCLAQPSSKQYQTINDSPSAISFSWEIKTEAVNAGDDVNPTATIIIDSTKVDADKLAAFETTLYGKDPTTQGGTDGVFGKMPTPAEVIAAFE